jgi:acyl dehydratase
VSSKKDIPFSEFNQHKTFDFGECTLSEEQIITYAKQWDPLPFHLSQEGGEKSVFGGLIASGPQIFHEIHKHHWLPLFGHSVVCGMGVNNWKFIKPIYPNQIVHSRITIINIEMSKAKKHAKVTWFYEFLDANGGPYQTLEMFILHSMA